LAYVDCVENNKDVYSTVRKIFDSLASDVDVERGTAPEIEKIPVVVKKIIKRNDIAFVFLNEDDENVERVKQVKTKIMDIECESEKFVIFCASEKEIPKKAEIVALLMLSPSKLQEKIGAKG